MAAQHTNRKDRGGMVKYDNMKAEVKFKVEEQIQNLRVAKAASGRAASRTTSSYTGSPDSETIANHLSEFTYHPERQQEILEKMRRF